MTSILASAVETEVPGQRGRKGRRPGAQPGLGAEVLEISGENLGEPHAPSSSGPGAQNRVGASEAQNQEQGSHWPRIIWKPVTQTLLMEVGARLYSHRGASQEFRHLPPHQDRSIYQIHCS